MLAGPEWYELPTVVVDERARKEIVDAKVRIAQRGHAPDGPRIIAALDLGFWTGLCNREYEQGVNTPAGHVPLWPALFHHLGAALPRDLRTRAVLSEYLGRVRLIRNRASHHEPLWLGERDRRGHRVPLSVDHARMQNLARSLNPRCGDLLRMCDRFSVVFDAGPDRWITDLRDFCARAGIEA